MAHKYTKEQHDFILDIAPGRHNIEITNLFNKKFGTNIKEGQIKSYKANHKIKSGIARKRRTEPQKLFTEEQENYIKEHIVGRGNKELTDMFNNQFGTNFKTSQIKAYKQRNKLNSGLDGQFERGHVPVNKGTKGLFNVGGNKTSFKKGQRSINYKPVGTERIDRDGYTLIKVSDEGAWHERWKHKHKVFWEKENGPIPSGHVLLFADGNKQNITSENLILVTRSQLARLNQNHLISDNAELTKTGIILADIYQKIGERKKSK